MALISSNNVIRSLALFHLTAAYFLLYSPSSVSNYGFVVLFSQSFRMVICQSAGKSLSLNLLTDHSSPSLPHLSPLPPQYLHCLPLSLRAMALPILPQRRWRRVSRPLSGALKLLCVQVSFCFSALGRTLAVRAAFGPLRQSL